VSLSLASLVQRTKRITRYGDPSVTTDQITADIVHSINQRALRIWRRCAWHWSIEEFTLSVIANDVDYTLEAAIGDIIAIETETAGEFFEKRTRKSLKKNDNHAYVRMGMDSDKNIKIQIWPVPSESATYTGWGKKRFTRYSVSDLATNTDIAFFPDEVLPVLEAGVIADIYSAQEKYNEAALKETWFTRELNDMVKEEAVEEDSEEESDAPELSTVRRRKNGGTTIT
jgi:hypothetical protein